MTNHEPETKPLYRCEWREVVALNFEVDPRILRTRLPDGTQLQQYNDRTLLTLVACNLREFRPFGGNLTLFRSVEQIDIRSYASCDVGGEYTKGFFRLRSFVSNKMCNRFIKFRTKELCETVSAKRQTSGFSEARVDALPSADYEWKIGDSENHFKVKARRAATKGKEGSKEEFVFEQDNQFSITGKGTFLHHVRKTPWPVWTASSGSFSCDKNMLGPEFRKYLSKPSFVLLSGGGEVSVSKGQKVS